MQTQAGAWRLPIHRKQTDDEQRNLLTTVHLMKKPMTETQVRKTVIKGYQTVMTPEKRTAQRQRAIHRKSLKKKGTSRNPEKRIRKKKTIPCPAMTKAGVKASAEIL